MHTYTDECHELFTAELILFKEEEEKAKSGSKTNKDQPLQCSLSKVHRHRWVCHLFMSSFQAALLHQKTLYCKRWTKYRVQSRKEVSKYRGISFPDFERNDVKNTSEKKAIISRMPLLVPDVCCFENKITGTATRESIHNSMRGEDVKKHRNGATSYVNGVTPK